MASAYAFHPGELDVQRRTGEASIAARNLAVMSTSVVPAARVFIERQNMLVAATVDGAGHLWSSVLFGPPGFLSTQDGSVVKIAIGEADRDRSDPFWECAAPGAPVGMLFIELGSRRRYRVNGELQAITPGGLDVSVREAYPNCPKYIQRRHLSGSERLDAHAPAVARGSSLTPELESIVRQADTLFIASSSPSGDLDASHRGGNPGFVQVLDARTLRIPDYVGNSLFNTLGNLSVNPECGIAVLDFVNQRVLHLSGSAQIRWDLGDERGATGGTGRFWDFEVREWVLRPLPQRLTWEPLDASPFNPPVDG